MLVHNELFGCACAGRSILYTPPTYYYSLEPVTHYSFLMKSYYAVYWEYYNNPPYFCMQLCLNGC